MTRGLYCCPFPTKRPELPVTPTSRPPRRRRFRRPTAVHVLSEPPRLPPRSANLYGDTLAPLVQGADARNGECSGHLPFWRQKGSSSGQGGSASSPRDTSTYRPPPAHAAMSATTLPHTLTDRQEDGSSCDNVTARFDQEHFWRKCVASSLARCLARSPPGFACPPWHRAASAPAAGHPGPSARLLSGPAGSVEADRTI